MSTIMIRLDGSPLARELVRRCWRRWCAALAARLDARKRSLYTG